MRSMIRISEIMCVVAIIAVSFAGCSQEPQPVGSPVESAWESPQPLTPADQPAAKAPVVPAQDTSKTSSAAVPVASRSAGELTPAGEVIAVVNGEPIDRSKLEQMLMESHGPAVLEQLILLMAAKQAAAVKSLSVTPADIQAAEEDALRRIAAPMGNPDTAPLDRPTAERLLNDFLRIKGLSRTEWDCRMEQRAYITKIANADVAALPITEQMLKDEYSLAYGERVQIRHIQTASQQAINRAAGLLKEKSFEEIARQTSENPITREQGGLMPPFTAQDGAVPPLIRTRAFAMKVGEMSEPLREGAWYHIIRIERRFPASGVGFENVDRDVLSKRFTDRLVRQRIDGLDAELFKNAKIQIRDRNLEKQFRRKHPGN